MLSTISLEEYIFTIGIVLAFVCLVAAVALGRKHISYALKQYGINRRHLAYALIIAILFLAVELCLVHATQLLYFDDAIYQAQALDLIHMGQAWMCDFGSPTTCFIGEVYHEPLGTAFNIAIGFALFGVSQAVAYNVNLFLSFIAVFLTFFVAQMLSKDTRIAAFSAILIALSPMLLVWARPTTSDVPTLAYMVLSLFFLMIFLKRKNAYTLAMLSFSAVLLFYMKVDNVLFLFIIFAGYMLLDDASIKKSIRKNYPLIKKGLSSTGVLIVLLLLVFTITPEIIYAHNEYVAGDYGYKGTNVQDTCAPSVSATASGKFNLQNFEYNACSNFYFWFDAYSSQDIMQPVFFTLVGILGAVYAFFNNRRELAFLVIWFLAFFILYTAFYAGSVTYGVDWRFMLSILAPASILGGFGCMALLDTADGIVKRAKAYKKYARMVLYVSCAVVLLLIAYSLYMHIPQLSVQPSQVTQAPDARFYESFVYNESYMIPNNCLVFTYDPTLFNLVNKTALQMYYYYNQSLVANLSKQYSCMVIDYGYWCYTPNNLCTDANSLSTLKTITNATYVPMGKTFSFYYVENYTT